VHCVACCVLTVHHLLFFAEAATILFLMSASFLGLS